VHAPEPVALFHVPVGHGEHGPPSGPVWPALHVQMLDALQPLHDAPELVAHATQVPASVAPVVVEYVPAAQSVHTILPVAILYLPATHVVHVPPFGPVKPALQVQAVSAELEIGELELVGHATHVATPVAATAVEYVFPPQVLHVALP
jgi:hypothetical protein